jgi:hypothetical protein
MYFIEKLMTTKYMGAKYTNLLVKSQYFIQENSRKIFSKMKFLVTKE